MKTDSIPRRSFTYLGRESMRNTLTKCYKETVTNSYTYKANFCSFGRCVEKPVSKRGGLNLLLDGYVVGHKWKGQLDKTSFPIFHLKIEDILQSSSLTRAEIFQFVLKNLDEKLTSRVREVLRDVDRSLDLPYSDHEQFENQRYDLFLYHTFRYLQAEHSDKAASSKCMARLASCKQYDRDLITYSDEYRDLVREYKILSSDSITLHESTLIERFITGLSLSKRYSILVSALRLRQADTLESAISTLLECDECSQEKLSSIYYANKQAPFVASIGIDEDPDVVCAVESWKREQRENRELKMEKNELENDETEKAKILKKINPQCFNCHEFGHISRFCPLKKDSYNFTNFRNGHRFERKFVKRQCKSFEHATQECSAIVFSTASLICKSGRSKTS